MDNKDYQMLSYPASNGEHDIFAWHKGPKKPRAIFQIAHGMAEHSLRYAAFGAYMVKQGFVVCANDHAGHGQSVNSKKEYGYFGPKGYTHMLEDMARLTDEIKALYPGLPLVLFGHSMGSFLAREYTVRNPGLLKAAIFMGTMGPTPLIDIALPLIDKFIAKYGPKEKSKLLNKLMYLGMDKDKKGLHLQFDWMTRDREEIENYLKDPLCGHLFTHQGYKDLCLLVKKVNEDQWFDCAPRHLPMLLISGAEDLIGDHGKGVTQVYNRLLNKNCRVEMILYEKARHELLFELNKAEVYEAIANWTLDKVQI